MESEDKKYDPEVLDYLFKKFDIDGDKKISFLEMYKAALDELLKVVNES